MADGEGSTAGAVSSAAAATSTAGVQGSAPTDAAELSNGAAVPITVSAAQGVTRAAVSVEDGTLTEGETLTGIVTPDRTRFFVPDLTLVAGGVVGFQLALENNTSHQVLGKMEVAGVPDSVTVKATSVAGSDRVNVVRVGPNAFMVQIAEGVTGDQVNMEVQLIADCAIEPGSYEPEIAIASLEGAEELDATFGQRISG